MASSKDDAKARKVMDVSKPGKTPPPASAKPIIVTNRPILRRDPMMASPNTETPDMEAPAEEEKKSVSRVAKTIKIMPLHADEAAPEVPKSDDAKPADAQPAEVQPSSAAEVPAAATTDVATPKGADAAPTEHHLPDAAVALEVGEEALASLDQPDQAAATEDVTDAPAGELTIDPAVEPEQVKVPHPADEAEAPTGTPASDAAGSKAASADPTTSDSSETNDASSTTEEASPDSMPTNQADEASGDEATANGSGTVEESETAGGEPETGSADGDGVDDQLAPNQLHAKAEHRANQAELERKAELEKIIDSKQFYLPIATHEKKRGAMQSMVVLLLVALLAVVWLDVVLDAGIVHIPNISAPTHFFQQH